MSERGDAYTRLARSIEELRDSMSELVNQLARLEYAVNTLNATAKAIPLVQLCRDQERDLYTLSNLNQLLKTNLQGLHSAMSKARDDAINELEKIDKQLEENLTGLLLPVIEFKKETKVIEYTLQKLHDLLAEMIKLIYDFYRAKRDSIIKLYEEIKHHVLSIMNETDQIRETLRAYSIKSPSDKPSIIGVPIIKVVVENAEKYAYLGKGLERYETRILKATAKTKAGVDYEILHSSIERIKRKKGLLYRLFLKKVRLGGGIL